MSLSPADLLHKVTELLDPHLSLMMLEAIEEKPIVNVNSNTVAQEKIHVLSRTKIYDYFLEVLTKLQTQIPAEELEALKKKTESEKGIAATNLAVYKKYSENFVNQVVEDKEKYAELEKEKFSKTVFARVFKSLDTFTKEELDYSVKYARTLFNIGEYGQANKVLNCLLPLIEDDETIINILWGKLISEILTDLYREAFEDLKLLQEKLEKEREKVSHMHVLANRVTLLHTAVYLYLNLDYKEEALENLIDLFTKESYLSAVQNGGPHLVRYLIGSIFLFKNSPKFDLNRLINLLPNFNPEVNHFTDSLNLFVLALLKDFDFKKAQGLIKDFKKDLEGDFFLRNHIDQIVNNGQKIFFEVYSTIYRKIEIKTVAEYLGVDNEKAEIWIVDLIRNTHPYAKVDPEQGVINLNTPQQSVYEQVFNKTKDLVPRTNILINNISRILKTEE